MLRIGKSAPARSRLGNGLLIALLVVCAARAAVVEGVVLDEETGNPLARTQVTLVPLPGTSAPSTEVRTGAKGSFTILSVQPGWYIVRATRRGYIPAESGQIRPGRPGKAFELASADRSDFIKIVMTHLATISGTVVDDNGIGIPDWLVHLYTAQKPIRHIGQVKTNERGDFRFAELDAGNYVVRSGPASLDEETTLLATFYKYGTALESAETVRVHAGESQQHIVIRPVTGKFFTIAGMLIPAPGKGAPPACLTYVTDTGRREILSASDVPTPFSIPDAAPGATELLVDGHDMDGKICAGYLRLVVATDQSGQRAVCGPLNTPVVEWRVNDVTSNDVKFLILARRADLDGVGPSHTLRSNEQLPPGHWELSVSTSPAYYVNMIRNSGSRPTPHDGPWFAVDVGTYVRLQINLSSRPASVSGIVTTGGKPVTGAPVYLETFDNDIPRIELRTTRTDPQGNYKFAGLAPGSYRAVSGFDVDTEERGPFNAAPSVNVAEGGGADLPVTMILP